MSQQVSRLLDRLFPSGLRRILFIVPPDVDSSRFNPAVCRIGRYANYPAYGAGLLAAHLRKDGIEVDVLNLHHAVLRACQDSGDGEPFEFVKVVGDSLARQIRKFNPDLAGISCMFSLTHRSAIETSALIRCVAPALPIAIGGVHPTNALCDPSTRDSFLADLPTIDCFFLGEGELALRNFVRVANRALPPSSLSQLLLRDGQQMFEFPQQVRPQTHDLETAPAHDLLSVGELSGYGKIGGFHYLKAPSDRICTVLSNRGCRGQCSFCSVRAFNGPGVRLRPVQSVIDELELLEERHGIRHVIWLDDDFLFDKAHALALFNGIVRKGLRLTWDCSNGVIAASCTDEVIQAAAESGCIGLVLGVESGNPQLLRTMQKPATVDTYFRAAEVLRGHPGINARVFLLMGFPGETYRMMRDTYLVAHEMDLDWCIIQVVQPLPNTPLFQQLVSDGLVAPEGFDDIRYSLGYYGKLKDKAVDIMTSDFLGVFEESSLDAAPSPAELDRVWAFLNYNLNFDRLKKENRPEKLGQQSRWLQFVTDLVTPEGAIALYYRGIVQNRLGLDPSDALRERLTSILAASVEWREQFRRLGLSAADFGAAPSSTPA